jgi:hypothetical protein
MERLTPKFVDGSRRFINTVPPNDFGHFELLNELVQLEPASAMDPEIAGQLAAIGIVKGKEFNPDPRQRAILEKAVNFANAAARTLGMGAHPRNHFRYYGEDSSWWSMLWPGGYNFLNEPPIVNADGTVKRIPSDNARKLHSRVSWFYTATGITPAMIMRLPNVGSNYIISNLDADGNPYDGAKTYKLVLPPNIPAANFWSLTVYDNVTRSMLQTPQRWPRAGSQEYPSPAAEQMPDGSTEIYFGPEQPEGVPRGNWIQTVAGKGWFQMIRFYSPTVPFFDKSWRPGETVEIE